jgi:hypothetical protein
MEFDQLKTIIFDTAVGCAEKGAGWAQESVVLREVMQRFIKGGRNSDLRFEQDLLTAWHDLFAEGKLAWGYDVSNPNLPFFHIANRHPVDISPLSEFQLLLAR